MTRLYKARYVSLLSATLCAYAVAACSDDTSSTADPDAVSDIGADLATDADATDGVAEMDAEDLVPNVDFGDELPGDLDQETDIDPGDAGHDLASDTDAPTDLSADLDLAPEVVDPCAPRPPPDTSAPWSRVGTGFAAFESLAPCQELPIIEGLQEGYHVWGGVEAGGFDAGDDLFVIGFDLTLEGVSIAEAVYNDFLGPWEREEDESYAYHTVPVALHAEIDPESLVGRTAVLSVELSRDLDLDLDLADSVIIVLGEIER